MKNTVFTGVSSGENLVNFINNASSSVKTVLSKPGCFKRNTNHRKFLQKQLRQTVKQQGDGTTTNGVTTPSQIPAKKPISNKGEFESLSIEKFHTTPQINIKKEELDRCFEESCVKPISKPIITRTVKQRTIRKKRRFSPISTTPTLKTTTLTNTPSSNIPPSIIIPSPTADYRDLEFESTFSSLDLQKNRKEYFSDRLQSPGYSTSCCPSNLSSSYPTTTMHFYRSNPTSYVTSEEDFGFCDFLSGEDLMKSLEFGDLFIPDYTNDFQKHEIIHRSFLENEKHLKYLTQLEALESSYYSIEHSLLNHNNFLTNSY